MELWLLREKWMNSFEYTPLHPTTLPNHQVNHPKHLPTNILLSTNPQFSLRPHEPLWFTLYLLPWTSAMAEHWRFSPRAIHLIRSLPVTPTLLTAPLDPSSDLGMGPPALSPVLLLLGSPGEMVWTQIRGGSPRDADLLGRRYSLGFRVCFFVFNCGKIHII